MISRLSLSRAHGRLGLRAFSTTAHPSGLKLYDGEGKGLGVPTPPSREPLYKESPLNQYMTRYFYLFKATGVFSRRARIGVSSEAIFRSIEEQATQDIWWEVLKLPKNWITEHALIALHVWIFHCRWKVDYNVSGDFSGRRMQEEVFSRLWEDSTLRIRNAGIAEISVNKQLTNVQKITFDDMFAYDAAWKVQEEDDGMELAAALWKGIWREDETADTEAVLRLADYVRREVLGLLMQPKEDVYRGWVTWGPCLGETHEDRINRQKGMLEGEWRDALAQDGRVYFYHTSTHERRWEMPEEGFYPRTRFAVTRYLEEHPEHRTRIDTSLAQSLPLLNATTARDDSQKEAFDALREKVKHGKEEKNKKGRFQFFK